MDFDKENNEKDHKFKLGGHVRISKYKNIFVKGYVPNLSEKVFMIKKVKNTVSQTYVNTAKKLLERFIKKNCKKQIQKDLY